MSYIGNQPSQVAFVTDSFSGNGSTTAFTMSVAPANTASVLVAVSGVLQDPSTYSVSGTTLTFSAAPPTGTSNISARYLGIPASGVTTTAYRTITEFTATAGQTTFTPPSYTVGFIEVNRNGVLLGSADYTATNGTTVVLTSGAVAGDLITTISFYVSSVLNAIPATAGSVGSTYLASNLTLGGTTSASIITTSASPAFEAGIGATTDATFNTGSNIPFNVTNYQRGTAYSNSTYAFTAPATGYYLFTVGLYFTNSASSTGGMQAGFVKNGSFISTSGGDAQGCISCTPNSLGGTIQLATSLVISLNSGDTVAVQPRSNPIRVYQGHCYFSGSFLG
jgi:hypothetical protein